MVRPLSPRTLRGLDTTVRAVFETTDAMLWASAPELGVGGSVWDVDRRSHAGGAGVMGPVGAATTHRVTGVFVLRSTDPRLLSTGLATQITDSDWTLLAPLGVNLQVGDLMRSVDVPGYAFRVKGLAISLSEEYLGGAVDEAAIVVTP